MYFFMIPEKISSKILTISVAYKKPKGGIAQVVNVYATFFEKFNHITTTKRKSKIGKVIDLLTAIFRTIYFLAFKNIKIVHIQGASYNSFWRKRIFIKLSNLFHKKVIYHIHGGKFQAFYKENKKVVQNTILKCDTIIALSGYWKNFFETIGHPNVQVVENVIEKPKNINASANGYSNFLFLGHLNQDKGIFDLLEVISSCKDKYKNKLRLFIGGSGETVKLNGIIKSKELNEIIKFEGWVSGEKKCKLLSNTDVYILPSYNEGLPISILEAMSYKLPIISTPVGGIPEVVEDGKNGLLIEPGNQHQLKEAINKLLGNSKLRKEMGEASFKRVQNHFPDQVEKKLTDIYSTMLNDL
jgi:glycosyltransferase involved in cell wall biosynthesis